MEMGVEEGGEKHQQELEEFHAFAHLSQSSLLQIKISSL